MFTGIIEQTGTLISLESRGGVRRITVEAPGLAGGLREGDSLGVSGVCLTALDVHPTLFHADLAQETLDKTSLGALSPGAKVNLELPTAAGRPLGGHIVQGHVDGCGVMTALDPVIPESSPNFDRQTTDWTLKVRVPENLREHFIAAVTRRYVAKHPPDAEGKVHVRMMRLEIEAVKAMANDDR